MTRGVEFWATHTPAITPASATSPTDQKARRGRKERKKVFMSETLARPPCTGLSRRLQNCRNRAADYLIAAMAERIVRKSGSASASFFHDFSILNVHSSRAL